jgi:hypothetical protein
MELPKLGIRDTYLFKFKWPGMSTRKTHLKRECPRKDLLILEDHEGVIKTYENNLFRKKMKKKMI